MMHTSSGGNNSRSHVAMNVFRKNSVTGRKFLINFRYALLDGNHQIENHTLTLADKATRRVRREYK